MYGPRKLANVGNIFCDNWYSIGDKSWKENHKYLEQISEEHNEE